MNAIRYLYASGGGGDALNLISLLTLTMLYKDNNK